jgi:hypothetical protein
MNGTSTEDIGMLDLITTRYLHSLGKFSELLFTAVLSSSSLNIILRKPNHKKTIVDISVNIIGPERIADDVGDILADDSAYLQHPFFLEAGTRYINPQYFYSRNENTDLKHLIGPPTIDSNLCVFLKGLRICWNLLMICHALQFPWGVKLSQQRLASASFLLHLRGSGSLSLSNEVCSSLSV